MGKKKNSFTIEGFFRDLNKSLKENDIKTTEQYMNSINDEEQNQQQEEIDNLF